MVETRTTKKRTRQSRHAVERIMNEIGGGRLKFEDGTVSVNGRVVKAGPRAIVVNGRLMGWRERT